VNRFRQKNQAQTQGEIKKIDASQMICETIQASQMKVWTDSGLMWIDSERVREFCDTTQRMNDMIQTWIDS